MQTQNVGVVMALTQICVGIQIRKHCISVHNIYNLHGRVITYNLVSRLQYAIVYHHNYNMFVYLFECAHMFWVLC